MTESNLIPRVTLTTGVKVDVGTIIHGTLRSCDVLSALADWTNMYAKSEYVAFMREVSTLEDSEALQMNIHGRETAIDALNPDDEEWAFEKLSGMIESRLPEGWTFQTHPGDGSDLGIWPVSLFDDTAYDPTCAVCESGDEPGHEH